MVPYPLETMLRIHLSQNWFSLSDPAMEEALYEITPMHQFAQLTLSAPIPEDTTILNLRHLLEKHKLAPAILAVINGYLQEKGLSLRQGTIVDATTIHAFSTTKNEEGKRDPRDVPNEESAAYADSGYTGVEKLEDHESREVVG
ncbi:transposase IS4 family protein [Pseudomonas mucidolens]|nr:transposase IS4 family protein [Pseudomonas mucidolens]